MDIERQIINQYILDVFYTYYYIHNDVCNKITKVTLLQCISPATTNVSLDILKLNKIMYRRDYYLDDKMKVKLKSECNDNFLEASVKLE